MFAAVTPPSPQRVRHYVGLPDAAERRELPRPSVALIDGKPNGFYLIRLSSDGTFCGDTWHRTAEEARGQAEFEFERVGAWQEIPVEVSDPEAYAVRHARTGVTFPDA
jgi:hypothetical protein